MTVQPDLRVLLNRIPRAPAQVEELLGWARNLVTALDVTLKDPYNVYTPDYASTLEFSPTLSNILKLNTVNATGNCTINGKVGKPGAYWFIITNDATSGKVITFGTNFLSSGTLTGTVNKTAIVEFISDGNKYYEVSRKTGL